MTCSYAGYLNIHLSARTFNGRSIVVNINVEQNDGSRRNAHVAPSSPVALVSWDQLLERGWRMAEDSSYNFPPVDRSEGLLDATQRFVLFADLCGVAHANAFDNSRGGSRGIVVEILVCVELDCLPGSYYFYFRDKPARSSARC